MTINHPSSPQADPARHDPSEVRPATCTCCGGAREADPTDENLRMLRRAATLSLEAMERAALRAQRAMAAEPEPDYAAADRADLGLQRAGRCLRFCVALSDKLHTDRLARDKKLALDAAYEVKQRKERVKSQVERLVHDAIEQPPATTAERPERPAGAERETESYDEFDLDEEDDEEEEDARQFLLRDALAKRFKDEDIEADLGLRPISELVGRLCADLKIRAPWERWDTQYWALDEVRRKVPGSPFAEMARAEPDAAEMPAAEAAPAEAGPEPAGVPPDEPEPPEPRAEDAKPEEPAGPVKRDKAWYQSAEGQREHEAFLARVRARYLGPPPS